MCNFAIIDKLQFCTFICICGTVFLTAVSTALITRCNRSSKFIGGLEASASSILVVLHCEASFTLGVFYD